MWLKRLHLTNIKSFADSGAIEFFPQVNLIVGPNNAGKSIIVQAISILQPLPIQPIGQNFVLQNRRRRADSCEVTLELEEPNPQQLTSPFSGWDKRNWRPVLRFGRNEAKNTGEAVIQNPNGDFQSITAPLCHQKIPDNFLFTYLSRRKPSGLNEVINSANAQTIEEALQHLPSKVDQLST